ncbi:beclin-1-like isoform X2 [Gigantopelta aegis]|uniref:beclin-1-like isoform X2 n=1 Tax=Gigantopelta aegis TaxID=1735272 RepID=UPI001B88DE87|nr:beclin-1-like isoform X2 [Gigantopelta aegis]
MTTPRPDVGKAGVTCVSFVCQKCRQPLKLDSSFNALDQPLVTELTAPLTTIQTTDVEELFQGNLKAAKLEEDENIVRNEIPDSKDLHTSQDFTLLGETGPGSMENLSHRLIVTAYLFDIMSGQSEVDHPLCEECTDALLDQLDHQLKTTEDECKDYRDFLEKLGTKEEVVDESVLDTELEQLRAEELTLQEQLAEVEKERAELAEMLEREKKISQELDLEDESYRKEYNEYKRQALELEDEQRSVDNQLRYAQSQLDKLKKTNVFNATFHIWHSGHFGTINNFRLGRLPSVPVDWNEINAAWGQTVLLLHSLAKKMNLTFQRYRLVPYGNHSYLESLTDKSKELPLYGSGGFRFFWDAKFDQAMVAFLDCLQQFKEEVEKGDTGFCLPYRMEKGKIEDSSTGNSYSIKIQFNSEEQWTKALKFMLTNLKWGLAWVSSQFANK